MIISIKSNKGYINEITRCLDKYLIKCMDCSSFYINYIYETPINDSWSIRVPGATRGYIRVKDNIIVEIKLYEDRFCYSKDVYNELDKFIGKEIVFN